ncbi:hypothetical protein OPKNFCMD_2616 [Methylobacterium crusticola]|uniref:Uncharacterized protein n=1 Tax=Methylobacterium crusticola TaxID=1697972 RepID=A0ABQ4QYD8_9HYPH|nr:hypothetical protein [Methylobacterium crusticola]GJD49880.1 hypothetical protein OPKNFCMD_2616 [Methylobacterium crusticola]
MVEARKERAFDGYCTVYLGPHVIITNLTDSAADALISIHRRLNGR